MKSFPNTFNVLILAWATSSLTSLSAQEESFERASEPYVFQYKSSKPGEAVSEVAVDADGVEVFWRIYYGYYESVSPGRDSDGDGVNDAVEAAEWTNPLSAEAPNESTTTGERRQAAVLSRLIEPLWVKGRAVTPAEELTAITENAAEFRAKLAEELEAAGKRVDAWIRRTGKAKTSLQRGRGEMIIDVIGDRPIMHVDDGLLSNDFAVVPPLWPGGAVGSNVTGYVSPTIRKTCGLWEVDAPRFRHIELDTRISNKDFVVFDPLKFHATFVAGIIAGAGTNSYYQGAAYGAKIDAYSSVGNLSEVSNLPLSTVKDMRASNHSYGLPAGWHALEDSNGTWRRWLGDLAISNDATGWEAHQFGLYTSEARTADQTAGTQPYHLMVKTSGNERGDSPVGDTFTLWRTIPGSSPIFLGYQYFYTFFNNSLVLYSQDSGVRKYVLEGNVTYDFPAKKAYISSSAPLYTLPGTGTLPIDGSGGYDSLGEGFTVAKNTLSVGAMANSYDIASYSGWGPTDDGRIKPDLLALGGEVEDDLLGLGSGYDTDYTASGHGTSFAAPAAAGAATLLSQYHENLRTNKEPLRSSTFRALLCHTATDVGITGPDYESGWGVVDTEEAANIIKTNSGRHKIAEVYIPSGSSANFTCIAVGGQPIKVTMAWTDPQGVAQPAVVDPPGTGAGLKVLTNDLDLRVTDYQPTTLTYLPWAPDPAFPAGNPVPTGDNFRDNIEQVIIPTSTTGEYIGITITPSGGTALVGGGQWVSLIMSGLHQNGPWPSELTVFSATYAYVDPTHVTATLGFGTKVGGYYRIQVRPYGSPEGYWANASPVFYSRANSMVATSDPQGTPGAMLTFRVVSVSPNPFNL